MFTGIIELLCYFQDLSKKGDFFSLSVSCDGLNNPKTGESIAINGICLTLTSYKDNMYSFDISAETLKKTTIGTFKRGKEMNLERSLRVGDRVGGHFVYGHIDCPGVLSGRYTRSSEEVFRFHVKENPQYLIPKGSISIDGISLTISSVISTGLFEVSVIPETVRRTNLDKLKINGRVNIEFDMVVKYLDGVSKNVRQH